MIRIGKDTGNGGVECRAVSTYFSWLQKAYMFADYNADNVLWDLDWLCDLNETFCVTFICISSFLCHLVHSVTCSIWRWFDILLQKKKLVRFWVYRANTVQVLFVTVLNDCLLML